MISKISRVITDMFISKGFVDKQDFELYHYGFFVMLSDIVSLCYCFVVGIMLKIHFASILFFVFFYLAHRFAGGYHAKSEMHCQVSTILAFTISIFLIKFTPYLKLSILLIIYLFCSFLLLILSPADTPQKTLTKKERSLFKKITSLILFVFFVLIIIIKTYSTSNYYVNAILVAIVLQTISVVFGRLFNYRLSTENL